jgi:hypothetical protein
MNQHFRQTGFAILHTPHTSGWLRGLDRKDWRRQLPDFLDFRKPAPLSQGCEVRAFLSSLDTGECGKFLHPLSYEPAWKPVAGG